MGLSAWHLAISHAAHLPPHPTPQAADQALPAAGQGWQGGLDGPWSCSELVAAEMLGRLAPGGWMHVPGRQGSVHTPVAAKEEGMYSWILG